MLIEIAQVNDIDTILALIEDLLAELGEEGQEFAGIDREKLHTDVGRNLDSGRFVALLARDDSGAAVGVLTLSESFALYAGGEYGVIDEMYVQPAFRNCGIGRQLVDAAVTIARQKRWYRLDVTGPEHPGPEGGRGRQAVRFYERLGFEFTGPKLRLLV